MCLKKTLLIGCSPSSGSTAIAARLNNIENIFVAPELCIFGNGCFFNKDHSIDKHLLSNIILGSYGSRLSLSHEDPFSFNPYPAINLNNFDAIGSPLEKLNIENSNLQDLMQEIFKNQSNYDYIIEKSPSNIWALSKILDTEIRYIHIVRNGYYAIASMVGRGFPLIVAAAIWTIENYMYSSCSKKNSSNMFLVKYEDFFRSEDDELIKLFQFISNSKSYPVFDSKSYLGPSKLDTWKYDVNEKNQKINNRLNLTIADLKVINSFKISIPKKMRLAFDNPQAEISFAEVMSQFGYSIKPNPLGIFFNKKKLMRTHLADYEISAFKHFIFSKFLR
ncbi:sulfotransferase [Gammaproteobacteria bacterium]|nr:sulfotransferase [Gammaproteobacteria bacterium]